MAINVNKSFSTISCIIENCGNKRIIPQNIYLIIEEGSIENDLVDFSYLLRHEEGEIDCVLSNLCKQGGVSRLPEHIIEEKFREKYKRILRLRHLSSETVMYVDPGEEFSEDIVLKLDTGIYRATILWTSVKEDCICATKMFIIE